MFVQVIVGLGHRPGRSWGAQDNAPFQPSHGSSRPSVNCLTLMYVVIVGFLTEKMGHVGATRIPSA
jgi:hypothetical protein